MSKSKRTTPANYRAELEAVISAEEAGAILGVGSERAKQFCREGRLAAKRIGRDWIVSRRAAEDLAKIDRPPIPKTILKKMAKGRR